MDISSMLKETMLLERLSGVALYAIVMFWMCSKIRTAENEKSINSTFNWYILILTLMGFFYVPGGSTDLARWLHLTREWHTIPFKEFFETHMLKSSAPIGYLMMYVCRLTRINGTLPALCAFLFHFNIFHIFKDLYKKHKISAETLSLVLMFFMSKGLFLEAIAGVRCLVSLSIISRCFYDEFVNNKSIMKNIIWELVAALMHPLALVLLTIRVFFMAFQKKDNTLSKLGSIFLVGIMVPVLYKYGSGYLNAAVDRAQSYITSDDMYSYIWEYIIAIITLLVLSVFIFKREFDPEKRLKYKNIFNFSLILFLVEIMFMFEYSTFHRVNSFFTIMMIPVMANKLEGENNIGLINLVKISVWIILLIAGARGNLCAYKFFLL